MEKQQIKIYDKNIKDFIKKITYKPVVMLGVKNDLQKIRDEFIKLYNPLISYLTYFISEAGYHGWDYESEDFKNMVELTKEIEKNF